MTIFQLRTQLIGKTPFAMTSFLQMAAYPNNGRAPIVAHPGSIVGLSDAMLRGTIWNRQNIFIEFASGSDCSLGWIDSVRCYPPRTERRMDQR